MAFLRVFRRHLAQHCIAYIALFFAMSGSAFAATVMWTGANIVDGSLTGADVQNGSITGADIQPGAVTAAPTPPIAQLDSSSTYDEPAWFRLTGKDTFTVVPHVLEHVTINMPTAGFVDVHFAATIAVDESAVCSDYPWINQPDNYGLEVIVDADTYFGAPNAAGIGWTSYGGSPYSSTATNSVWLSAGDHAINVLDYGVPCVGSFNGQAHISDMHVLLTHA